MKKFLGFLILFAALQAKAQHSTLRFTDAPINLNSQSLLVVPFERTMYLSDVNPVIAKQNQMTTEEIVNHFTMAIDQSIRYQFEEKCQVSSFYELEDQESSEDLKYIFSNLKLEYELVSETEEKSKLKRLKEKVKKEDRSYQRGQIQGGQIVTTRDDRERYMKAVVKDPKMLDSMHFKFNNKYFLFINELDIRNDYSDGVSMQRMEYDRLIKLHYTLYHKNGNILTTGISKTTFPATQNDIDEISKKYFPILAEQIFADLFPPEEEKQKSKFNLNKWK
jgi:hypothetical protein